MAFTEFYCDASSGSNLNGGSNAGAPTVAAVTGTVSGTTFTGSASDFDSASVGEWCAVYQLGVDDVAKAVGRITSKGGSGESVTVSAWLGGTPSGSENRCVVGGAWKGPESAPNVNFPFGFVAGTFQNADSDYPRVNFKSGTNYRIMVTNAVAEAGPVVWQGYTTSVGDGGRAVFQGLAAGTRYQLLYTTGAAHRFEDVEFYNNGNSGVAVGSEALRLSGDGGIARRVIVHDVFGIGIWAGLGGEVTLIECEAYGCNTQNQLRYAGMYLHSAGCMAIRCNSHHNTGNVAAGIHAREGSILLDCIANNNGGHGIWVYGEQEGVINCDSYDNGGDGLHVVTGSNGACYVENCNFVKNGGYGINNQGTNTFGMLVNCGFGAGTQANASGDLNADNWEVVDSVNYASDVTPWNDPANGDFRITLAAAKNTGRGNFLQTDGGYAGTLGRPDIGAARAEESAAGVAAGVLHYHHQITLGA